MHSEKKSLNEEHKDLLLILSRRELSYASVAASGTAEEGTPEDGGTGADPQDVSLEGAEGEEDGGADEEEDLKPAAKHGWNEDEPQADATPEAGPQGRASQTAAAQASFRALPGLRRCPARGKRTDWT